MAKYLRPQDVQVLELFLQDCMSLMEESNHAHHPAYTAIYDNYNDFSDESNTATVLADCVNAVSAYNAGWAAQLNGMIATGIRH